MKTGPLKQCDFLFNPHNSKPIDSKPEVCFGFEEIKELPGRGFCVGMFQAESLQGTRHAVLFQGQPSQPCQSSIDSPTQQQVGSTALGLFHKATAHSYCLPQSIPCFGRPKNISLLIWQSCIPLVANNQITRANYPSMKLFGTMRRPKRFRYY